MKSSGRATLSSAGALTTAGAAAATLFCCLPFASGIIGAGVAALGARFAAFRPYLAGLSLALLGYAFYQAYRASGTACEGEACERPSRVRQRRIALWLVAAFVVLLLTASWWANWVIYWTL